jgi:hypothetical protein
MSILSALLLVAVMAWRFAGEYDPYILAGFGAVIAWVAASLVSFRKRLGQNGARADDVAASGIEYYRRELEQRRDYLRNAWIWHGPMVLACLILAAVLARRALPGVHRLRSVVPLLVLLAVWAGFGFVRRVRLARQVQREIDELNSVP